MKNYLLSICIIFYVANSFASFENESQDIADCIAAYSITNADMQIRGDHANVKTGRFIISKLTDVFYEKLSEYKNRNPNIDVAFLGQMPNRSASSYSLMGDLQQMRYAANVVKVNNCLKYVR